jgi:hypothetical protein
MKNNNLSVSGIGESQASIEQKKSRLLKLGLDMHYRQVTTGMQEEAGRIKAIGKMGHEAFRSWAGSPTKQSRIVVRHESLAGDQSRTLSLHGSTHVLSQIKNPSSSNTLITMLCVDLIRAFNCSSVSPIRDHRSIEFESKTPSTPPDSAVLL